MGMTHRDAALTRLDPSLPLLVLLLVPAVACDAVAAPAFTVADSAGIRIVENLRPAWTEARAWSVDPEPLLDVGGPALELTGVVAAARLPGGGLVIADGADRLLFVRADGTLARVAGGAGEGPGEYRMVAGAGVAGDTVWSYDFALRRITLHDTAGELLAVAPVATPHGSLVPVGWSGGLVAAPTWSAADAGAAVRAGLRRDTVPWLRFDPAGRSTGSYGRFAAREYVLGVEDGRRTMATPLFARSASHALRGDRLLHGDRERYEIRVARPDGSLEALIRRVDAGADVSIDEGARDRERSRRLAAHGDDPGLRRFLAELPAPATRPAHGDFLADAPGFLWVAPPEPDAEGSGWSVFDPSGQWLGEVAMPAGFRPLQVLDDVVVGVRTGALDVERVQVLRLRRGAGGGTR